MALPFRLPRFYPILDTALLETRKCLVSTAVEALVEAGVRVLQYRHKDDWTQTHFEEAKKIAELCQDRGVLFVLNDRADFARALKSALHVGQDDLPPLAARKIISDEVMGLSTHDKLQLMRGDAEAVEYISIGPIFPTQSKLRPDPVVGLPALTELRKLTDKPLVAIGGVNLQNALDTLHTKVDSLAVISGWIPERADRKSIRRQAEQWLQLLA